MTTTSNLCADSRPEWHESFPETRTLPGGWFLEDLSLVAPAMPATPRPDWHESFPKLRTIPAGWDLSGVLAAERRMDEKVNHSGEEGGKSQLLGLLLPISLDAASVQS
jgi:hypothetical protein